MHAQGGLTCNIPEEQAEGELSVCPRGSLAAAAAAAVQEVPAAVKGSTLPGRQAVAGANGFAAVRAADQAGVAAVHAVRAGEQAEGCAVPAQAGMAGDQGQPQADLRSAPTVTLTAGPVKSEAD